MSSLRNAVSRRPHKERSQPQSRTKWGLLEKHKDYSLRAQDYNLKKKKLSQLSKKAEQKNPDEFAFGMLSAGTATQGKHGAKGNENRLSHDAVKLLKTQDAGYLKTVIARGRKEVGELERRVVLQDVLKGNGTAIANNKIFLGDNSNLSATKKRMSNGDLKISPDLDGINGVEDVRSSEEDDEEEPTTTNAVLQDHTESGPESRSAPTAPKSKKVLFNERKALVDARAVRKRRKKLQELRAAKLEALKKRQREILAAADILELQRAKMAKTVGGVNKNGVKFRIRERKK